MSNWFKTNAFYLLDEYMMFGDMPEWVWWVKCYVLIECIKWNDVIKNITGIYTMENKTWTLAQYKLTQ